MEHEEFKCVKTSVEFPPIPNYDNFGNNREKIVARHGQLLPSHVRAIFVGPTCSGKTNAAIHLLLAENGIRFSNLVVISPTLDQKKYEILEKILSDVNEICYVKLNSKEEFDNYLSGDGKLLPNTVLLIDDMVGADFKGVVKQYFSVGRHKQIDVILIVQSYMAVPKTLTREQANLIFIFRIDGRNLEHIWKEHCFHELNFTKFARLCNHAWNYMPNNCLIIDKTRGINNGKFRRSLSEFYVGL